LFPVGKGHAAAGLSAVFAVELPDPLGAVPTRFTAGFFSGGGSFAATGFFTNAAFFGAAAFFAGALFASDVGLDAGADPSLVEETAASPAAFNTGFAGATALAVFFAGVAGAAAFTSAAFEVAG
jgi:hypothetical protein